MLSRFQKMALRLFATTVLIFVPTCVMAQSENALTKNVITEVKGFQFSVDNASRIKIELKDPIKYSGQPLYFSVNLEGAKWLDAINTSSSPTYFPGATFKKINDTKLEVKISNSLDRSTYYIPLLTEITGGEAKVSIEADETTISDMTFTTFAVTGEQKSQVTAGEVKGVREEGTVGNIKVEEFITGSLVKSDKETDRAITLTLLNPNYEFDNDKLAIEPSRGFTGMTGIWSGYAGIGNKSNKSILYVQMPQRENTTVQGRINISEIKVKSLSKEIKPGKIEIKVSGPNVQETIVTVAEVKDYSITVANKSSKLNQIKVGSKGIVNFSIKENVLDSMLPGKTVEVRLNQGYFSPNKNASISDLRIGSIKLNKQDVTKHVSLRAINRDGFLVGFSFDVLSSIDNKELNEMNFENVQVYAPAGSMGDVNLTVNAVGIKGESSTTVASIKTLTSVGIEPIRLKVGVKDQKGGKITITETDKEMIKEGVIELEIEAQEGIRFPEEPIVTVVEGDLKIDDVRYDGVKPNMLKIYISRSSTKASSVEIKNFIVTTDGTVPDGSYKLMIKGSAIAPDTSLGALEYDNFMIVGGAPIATIPTNTEVKKSIAKFIIDSNIYDVNGQKRTMDAKAYVEGSRTMVPLRYVADAIGITSNDIKFDNNVITLKTPQKTIVLYSGESKVLVNNKETLIGGKVITKLQRTYVPVAEIARLLDIKVTWDAATQTAVFEK